MSWITDDWRLKLLAVVLAVLLLGAVAFSQNPPTTRTLSLPLSYTPVGPNQNLVILNRPATVAVTFSGLADVIGNASVANFSATVQAQSAKFGQAVKLDVAVTTTLNVSIQNPAPIVVRVDNLVEETVPITVSVRAAPGWALVAGKTSVIPATVTFLGPQSWEPVTATVVVPEAIAASQKSYVNLPIQLNNSSGALQISPCTTQPCASLDVNSVSSVTVQAQSGTTSTTVALVAATPSQLPPPQYEITGVSVVPATIVITGDPTTLQKIQRIQLFAVDLSGATGTVTIQVNIPFPPNVTPLNGVATAKITYTIQKIPSVSPSP